MDDGEQHEDDGRREPSTDAVPLAPLTSVRRQRPKALWAVLAVLAIAAGALAVTAISDDGSDVAGAPLPIALFGSARAEAAMAADSSLPWGSYEAGPDLPALGGTAVAYRLASVAEADVLALAAALDLAGAPAHEDGTWTVTDGDRTLSVSDAHGGSWWYSPMSPEPLPAPAEGRATEGGSSGSGSSAGAAGTTPDCGPGADCVDTAECPPDANCLGLDDCGVAASCAAPTTTTFGPCDEPGEACEGPRPSTPPESMPPDSMPCAKGDCGEPPVDRPVAELPSEDAARSIALDLLEAAGVDVDDAIVRLDPSPSAWFVVVEPRLDGRPSGLVSQVVVGSKGAIESAGGYLGRPEPMGSYPVLTTHDAIERANEVNAAAIRSGFAEDLGSRAESCTTALDHVTCEVEDEAGVGAAGDEPVASSSTETTPPSTDTAVAPDGSTEPGVAVPDASIPGTTLAPPPADVPTTPAIPAVLLVEATPSLVVLPSLDGTETYVVPAYRFSSHDGGEVDLPAISDESITGTPSTDTTVPGTEVPDPPPVIEPDPGCEVLVEEDASGTTHTVQPCPPSTTTEPTEPAVLPPGEEPVVGVRYYVDVDLQCGPSFRLGATVWVLDAEGGSPWDGGDEELEGGTFTLDGPAHGTFVGDAAATKLATFRTLGPAEDLFCQPATRR